MVKRNAYSPFFAASFFASSTSELLLVLRQGVLAAPRVNVFLDELLSAVHSGEYLAPKGIARQNWTPGTKYLDSMSEKSCPVCSASFEQLDKDLQAVDTIFGKLWQLYETVCDASRAKLVA